MGNATFNQDGSAIDIDGLRICDADVLHEARRWTTGKRAAPVDDRDQLAHADLTAFITEAVKTGSVAMSATGQARDAQSLERLLKDVGQKTAAATTLATEATQRAAAEAAESFTTAAAEARKAVAEADERHREQFTKAVGTAKESLTEEMRKIFGGDNPELIDRLRPVLDKVAVELDKKVSGSTSELLTKVARQFDPADPTSPMAKHSAEQASRQKELTDKMRSNHTELNAKVDQVLTAVRVQEAKKALAVVTPIKGGSYESEVNLAMAEIAAGLGDEYVATGNRAGRLRNCKKGDGVLTFADGKARVVVEATDSERNGWNDYLDEAERNRDAGASLGLVRSASQNGDQTVRVIGTRRLVMAFDPATDDHSLLRAVVMILRTAAHAATRRQGSEQIATANERIREAIEQLAKIDGVKKLADGIRKNATKIEGECTKVSSAIERLLDGALAALEGIDTEDTSTPGLNDIVDGAA